MMVSRSAPERSGFSGATVAPDRAQRLLGCEPLDEGDGGAGEERRQQGAVEPEGMREGQRGQHHIRRGEPHHGPGPRLVGGAERGMREDGPLGAAGAPRGVEDQGWGPRLRGFVLALVGGHVVEDDGGGEVTDDGLALRAREERIEGGDRRAELEAAPEPRRESPVVVDEERDPIARADSPARE